MNIMKNTPIADKSQTSTAAGPSLVRHFSYGDKLGTNLKSSTDLSKLRFREARQKVKNLLIETFNELMSHSSSNRYWAGTMTDLMELTHEIWLSSHFDDGTGRQISFRKMAAHVCRVLNCRNIPNPYTFVEKSRHRKCVLIEPILDRYTRLALAAHLKNPMYMEMKFRR